MRLRMPFALLAALVVVLFSSGAASADDETESSSPASSSSAAEDGGTITESLAGLVTSGSATTTGVSARSAAVATTGSLPDAVVIPSTGTNTSTSTNTNSSGSSGSTTTSSSGNPGTCIAAVVQKLMTDLQAALGENGEELAAEIQAALANPANLPTFLDGLPTFLQDAGEELSAQGELLLTEAGEDLQKCLPAPPAGGGSQTVAPTRSSAGNSTPPAQQPFTYPNCDQARAAGAAPVYAGQYGYGAHLDSDSDGIGCEETATVAAQPVAYADSGKLAYTGVPVEPLIAWGAALALSGGWLILSGRRRA